MILNEIKKTGRWKGVFFNTLSNEGLPVMNIMAITGGLPMNHGTLGGKLKLFNTPFWEMSIWSNHGWLIGVYEQFDSADEPNQRFTETQKKKLRSVIPPISNSLWKSRFVLYSHRPCAEWRVDGSVCAQFDSADELNQRLSEGHKKKLRSVIPRIP